MPTNPLLDDQAVALLLDMANLACHKGFPAQARVMLDGVLSVRPNFAPALITLAYSHLVVDDFDQVFAILTPVLEANPDDADARIVEGMAFLLSGKNVEAQESFAHLAEGSPQKQLALELAAAF
ncbi:MAG: tetratricopeptide repeat protein [Desulfovibrio sp.]|nr:tetratricopeptide repeat protein [Desulfovibrio sp.]